MPWTSTVMRSASNRALRWSASRILSLRSVGDVRDRSATRLVTPLTPVISRTARSAASFWKYQSTSPSRVTHPLLTFTVMRSSGTLMFHLRASTAARAISGSVRDARAGRRTSRSLAIPRTPFTLLATRSALHLSE